MKKVLLLNFILLFSFSAFAQVKILEVQNEADTLLFSTSRSMQVEELLDLYKNTEGYMFKIYSSNVFDITPRFYIGKTKQEAIETLASLIEMCNADVATKAIIEDKQGNKFHTYTAWMQGLDRKPVYQKSDRIHLSTYDMAGTFCLRVRTMEDAINYLRK